MSPFRVGPPNAKLDEMVKALGLDPKNVRRLVIDFQVGNVAKVYVEQYATTQFLEIISPTDILDMEINILDTTS